MPRRRARSGAASIGSRGENSVRMRSPRSRPGTRYWPSLLSLCSSVSSFAFFIVIGVPVVRWVIPSRVRQTFPNHCVHAIGRFNMTCMAESRQQGQVDARSLREPLARGGRRDRVLGTDGHMHEIRAAEGYEVLRKIAV